MTGTQPVSEHSRARPLADLLDDIHAFLTNYVALPNVHAEVAVVLFVAHTWVYEHYETTPRLAVLSPEPESGKTRLLEILYHLCRNPLFTSNISQAALFRTIDQEETTILLDEADAIFNNRHADYEPLRSILNTGHRRIGGFAVRMDGIGTNMQTRKFNTFSPAVIAGIGTLPDTILSRAIVIPMRRRREEQIETYRERKVRAVAAPLREELEAWSDTPEEVLEHYDVDLPQGIEDRAADIWEPLINIADLAGRHWKQDARDAAVWFTENKPQPEQSKGIKLLTDIRTIFTTSDKSTLPTTDLLTALHNMEESPWGQLFGGNPINANYLARTLRLYGIESRKLRLLGEKRAMGYTADDFRETWDRYLPDLDTD